MASDQVFRGACTKRDSAVGWFHHHPAEVAMASNTQIPETRQEYLREKCEARKSVRRENELMRLQSVFFVVIFHEIRYNMPEC